MVSAPFAVTLPEHANGPLTASTDDFSAAVPDPVAIAPPGLSAAAIGPMLEFGAAPVCPEALPANVTCVAVTFPLGAEIAPPLPPAPPANEPPPLRSAPRPPWLP